MENREECKERKGASSRALTIVGAVLCVIFGLMLICNLTIIIKGMIDPDRPPSVFGVTPLVVLSGSMSGDEEGHIEVGDLVFVGKADTDKLEVGDVITFKQGKSVTTHRIIKIETGEDGKRLFSTKGDANNTKDKEPVSEDQVIGVLMGRIPKVGDFALFMQTPVGMVVFIGIPLLAFIIYDIIRRQHYANRENRKAAELEAELQRLRALADEKERERDPQNDPEQASANTSESSEE